MDAARSMSPAMQRIQSELITFDEFQRKEGEKEDYNSPNHLSQNPKSLYL